MRFTLSAVAAAVLLAGCASSPEQQTQTNPATLETGGEMRAAYENLTLKKSHLFFDIDPETQSVAGKTTLTLAVKAPQSAFELDLDNNYSISTITAADAELQNIRHENGIIHFSTASPVAAGDTLTVAIAYQGKPHVAIRAPWDGGYVWSQTDSGKPWIATAVQGEGCDLIWPCLDHPVFEPEQTDIVIRVPKGLVAASNGLLMEQTEGDDWSQYHWRSTQLQNNYGIALNIGPYETIEATYESRYGHSYPLVLYYLEGKQPQAEKLFEEFYQQLDFYEDVIGPYPFYAEKMGVVETPHKGMEHQTINAYGVDYKPTRHGFDWLLQHELAHEWFGNQITNTDWDHMWLHEGFGTYMQPLYGQYMHGDFVYNSMMYDSRIGIRNDHPIVSNKPMGEDDVYKPDRGPGSDIYQKGSWILHTLRHLIGDEAFFDTTRQLVYRTTEPKPGNFEPHFADTQYFIDAVNEQTGEDYTWFFEHYLYTAALPELVETQQGNQLQLHWKTHHESDFSMPVEVKIGDELRTLTVGKQPVALELPSADTHYIVDPHFKILKQEDYIDAFSEYRENAE